MGLEGYSDPRHPEFHLPAAGPYRVVWANQWEPPGTRGRQFAADCYRQRFGAEELANEDIAKVLDEYESELIGIPDSQMFVGGFPCQDYSVAKPLSASCGIEGKKGVLWWEIHRILRLKRPQYALLENVDRLLKSPASQRGRDFAIILSCLAGLGYSAEWHVVNSAEHGFPQRRKRVFLYAELADEVWNLRQRASGGVMARALPIKEPEGFAEFTIPADPYEISQRFGLAAKKSPFLTGGVMQDYRVLTFKPEEDYRGKRRTLGDILVSEEDVPERFYIPEEKLGRWRYLKGSKREERTTKEGFTCVYSEGLIAFPDPLTRPSRTILTGEGGSGASRFKHVIQVGGRYRRLVPEELEQLQEFPRGWTATGMSDNQRAFCMGNALVVGIPHMIGEEIARGCSDESGYQQQTC